PLGIHRQNIQLADIYLFNGLQLVAPHTGIRTVLTFFVNAFDPLICRTLEKEEMSLNGTQPAVRRLVRYDIPQHTAIGPGQGWTNKDRIYTRFKALRSRLL